MKRKNLLLTAAATAVLGAFNPAFAGGGEKHGSADASYPPMEQSASGSSESRSGDEINVGADLSVDRDTGETQSPARDNAQFGGSDMTMGGNVGPQASAERSQDVDPRTGLDRAHPAN